MVARRDPAGDLDVERLVVEVLQRDQPQDQFAPFGDSVRVGKADAVEARLQAVQVIVEPERLLRIHRHQFVDAVPEDEAAVEHGNLRLGQRQELAVEVGAHLANISRIESQPRPKMPATSTSCRATSG
jgi:hypothetical protein